MSIWGTFLSIEDEREVAAAMETAGVGYGFICDDGELKGDELDGLPGEMLDAPIVYHASHVLPSETDERGGYVSLSSVGGFVEREGREIEKPDDDALWPFLRVEVGEKGGDDATVVLALRHVERVHASLGRWLELARPLAEPRRTT